MSPDQPPDDAIRPTFEMPAHDPPDPAPPRRGLLHAPLAQLVAARLREFYREPAAVFWVYGFPLLLAVVLGFAFRNRPVERIPVDVAAADPADPAAVKLRASLEADARVIVTVSDPATASDRLRTGKTGLLVTPTATPPGYEYTLDPDRPESVLAKAATEGALLRAMNPALPAAPESTVTEPGGRYIDFLLPGLLGANLMGGGLFGVGFVIVDMRVRKLLKRYLATPMRKTDFLLSLVISRLAFTVLEVGVLLLAGRLFFGVTVRGNPLALVVLLVFGASAFAGLGLLIASRARTLETVSGLMNAIMLPMYLVGGVFFAADRFPAEVLPVIRVLPLTALNDGLRAVINDGGGWGSIAFPCAVLTAWGGGSFALAARLFRWL